MLPDACAELVREGHEVWIERGAGTGAGRGDDLYVSRGVRLAADADTLYGSAELIVKVKEPWGAEITRLRSDHRLFSFLHLAADPALTQALCRIGLTAIAFETVVDAEGRMPLLAPMSDIAGRLAVQTGVTLLHRPRGGKGILLGGGPGLARGTVVVLGAGSAGMAAAEVAAGLGVRVLVLDRRMDRLAQARTLGPNVEAIHASQDTLTTCVRAADLLIGAVLVPGARAPRLVTRELVAQMEPGSVIADISVDQGGCVETTHATTWDDPVYVEEGVSHFAVTNMPGAVPVSASEILSAVLLPWVRALARPDADREGVLARAVNVRDGAVVHPALQTQPA